VDRASAGCSNIRSLCSAPWRPCAGGTSRDIQHMVLHALYVAAQSAVDLAMHIRADAGLPQAGSYEDAFRRLGEAGTIEKDLGERLAAVSSAARLARGTSTAASISSKLASTAPT